MYLSRIPTYICLKFQNVFAAGDDGEGGGEVDAPETCGQNNPIRTQSLKYICLKFQNIFV